MLTGTRHSKAFILGAIALTTGITAGLAAPGAQAATGTSLTTQAITAVAAKRAPTPPFVHYPVSPSASPVDARNYRAGSYNGTDIAAPCGSTVVAATPGTVRVVPNTAWAGGNLLHIITSSGKTVTYYGFMRSISVQTGQIVQAGQPVGTVGNLGQANRCELNFQVRDNKRTTATNPTTWLETYVGKRVPESHIFNNAGFDLVSLNVLGASHTDPGGSNTRYPSWQTRLPRTVKALDDVGADVIGFQELQKRQSNAFREQAGSRYAIYPPNSTYDTENSIAWRRSTFEVLQTKRVDIPYFDGKIRKMPYVLLRQKSTGYTAWFINVHNPANTSIFPNQGQWRAKAIEIERKLVVQLRAQGRPVFLTGDLNARAEAFCPLTAGKLMLSADSIASTTCKLPAKAWIDWIFAAGQARFSNYIRDWSFRDADKASDHPLVAAKVHISG